MFKLVKRKVTTSEANLLIDKIKLTPYIMGYSFKEWMSAENIIVAENETGHLVGVCFSYDFHEHWRKIAVLFVIEKFRNKGIGKLLFYESCQDAIKMGKKIYTISANPYVIKMIQNLDFILFDSLMDLPKIEDKLIFYFHSIKWLINFYRLQEIARKLIVYKNHQKFFYCIKIVPLIN
jgi:predicted GNAT family acetyltransferase